MRPAALLGINRVRVAFAIDHHVTQSRHVDLGETCPRRGVKGLHGFLEIHLFHEGIIARSGCAVRCKRKQKRPGDEPGLYDFQRMSA